MPMRIPWDKYEVAYLLDLCVKVEQGLLSRNDAVSSASAHLRKRAVSKGIEIDDVFRNENGISMQLAALRGCYMGLDTGLTISKLFREIVTLYREDRSSFDAILQENNQPKPEKSWDSFLVWLEKTQGVDAAHKTVDTLNMVSIFARKNRVIDAALRDIVDSSVISNLQKLTRSPKGLGIQSKKLAYQAVKALAEYEAYLFQHEESAAAAEEVCIQRGATESPQEPAAEVTDRAEDQHSYLTVDFSRIVSMAHTKPVSCIYRNNTIPCRGWNALFINLMKAFYTDYADAFPVGQPLLAGSSRIDAGAPDQMIYPKEIANGVYLECNVSATGIVKRIGSVMELCSIPIADLSISYRRTSDPAPESSSSRDAISVKEAQYTEAVIEVLKARYVYGFRLGSPIELMRFRGYATDLGLRLPSEDDELAKAIESVGLKFDGKVFVFDDSVFEELNSMLTAVFTCGAIVVFIEQFMAKNSDWFDENHIVSEEMLKQLIRKSSLNLYCGQNIISSKGKLTEHEAIVAEIDRVWPESAIAEVSELEEALEYIPCEKIAFHLSASDSYVWVSEGRYCALSRISISGEDVQAIRSYVASECTLKGYASIADIPIDALWEKNFELTLTALQTAVYLLALKDDYYLNGKILTKEPDGVGISTLLTAYCQEQTQCTLDDVMDRAVEITGDNNRQHSFEALYNTMIRVDKDRFVCNAAVDFCVDQIDELLNGFFGDGYGPIKLVSTFALFPMCGYPWNHYLLESFCYRYSKRYRLCVMNYNDKNAGIIASNAVALSYNEMLCEAAAVAPLVLTPTALGTYFFENGYTAKSKYSGLPEIIEKAKQLREER